MQGQRLERGKPRVLIVDDEPHIVEFLRMGFDYEGFEVASATDGAEALKVAQAQKPTSSSSTSCCQGYLAWRWRAACARRGMSRSSCLPRVTAWTSASPGWIPAPTTT